MGKYKHERGAAELEGDGGSTAGAALNEASMARRSFLGRIWRGSAALGFFALGAEAWMQAVPRRSILSSAVAAGAPRDRRFHPFPSDDPFNMPLGVNAWYAPTSDPATSQIINYGIHMTINNGWSFPVYITTTSDPLQSVTLRSNASPGYIESYRSDEDLGQLLQEHLPSDAKEAGGGGYQWPDGVLLIVKDNDIVENFVWQWVDETSATCRRVVRNRLDRYCFASFGNPLRNRAGIRAAGFSCFGGLIRMHEVNKAEPHIPHALAMAGARDGRQLGTSGDGPSSSPLHSVNTMFPAHMYDRGGYPNGTGAWRTGMRFALDPTIATDAWIDANAPNIHQRAVARALRDYGVIVGDQAGSTSVIYGEQGIPSRIETNLQNLGWLRPHMRRVAGAGPIHSPLHSTWENWKANGQGWGGGAPRVPYSPPLSQAVPPQSPAGIEVTESWRCGDTA